MLFANTIAYTVANIVAVVFSSQFGGSLGSMRTKRGPNEVLYGKDLKKEKEALNAKDARREKNEKKLFGDLSAIGGLDKVKGKIKREISTKSAGFGTAVPRRSYGASHFTSRTGNFVVELKAGERKPFFLPDTRADRLLRLDLGSEYYCTSSFPADTPGTYHLALRTPRDPTQLKHVSTRSSAEYTVQVPPDGDGLQFWNNELGVWFETDWDHKGVVVKGCKRDKYAFNHTDIHPGDVLTHIDNKRVDDLVEDGKIGEERRGDEALRIPRRLASLVANTALTLFRSSQCSILAWIPSRIVCRKSRTPATKSPPFN